MTAVNLKSLIGKMNETTRRTLEAAAGLCLSRTHYNIEVEHWLMKLLEVGGTDIAAILSHFDCDIDRVKRDLTRVLDKLKTGNSRPPALAPSTCDVARDAWLHSSVEFGDNRIRSGHLLYAMLADDGLRLSAIDASPEFEKINRETLKRELRTITSDTAEQGEAVATTASAVGAPGAPKAKGPTSTPALDSYTINLTARAKAGKIDPILGRDGEIRQIIDILTRRRQNNPILTGEAGVGKTAVAEGFALRIAAGDVPPSMENCSVRTLDLGLLQAGAGMKGEFENRLKQVMDEVKSSPTPIILFIDEAHTMVGAGGAAGQGDAANLLKPALARGDLRTIAATTWAEYKKYFEKDAALARRFQVVKVEEPSEPVCEQMMRGLVGTLEKHHEVRILNEGVVDAVKLSNRYISGRQLPDKAVSVLDTACARVNLSQTSVPPAIEDARRQIDQLRISIEILQREQATGAEHEERIQEMREELGTAEAALEVLETQWNREKELVEQIQEIQAKLSDEAAVDTSATEAAPESAAPPAPAAESPPAAEAQTPGDIAGAAAEGAADAAEAAANAVVAAGLEAAAAAVGTPGMDPAAAAVSAMADQAHAGEMARLKALTTELEELQGEHPMIHYAVDSQAVGEVISSWTGIPVGRMVSNEIENVLNLKDRMAERVVGQDHALDAISQSIRTSRAKLEDPNRPIGVFLMVGPSGVGKTETALTLAEQLYGGEQNMTVINMSEFKEEHKVSLLMGSPPGYVGYGEGGVLTNAVRRRPYSVVLLDEMEKAHPGVQDIFYQVFDKGQLRDGEGRDVDFKNTVVIMTSNAATDEIMKLCADPETMPDHEGLQAALHPHLLDTFKPAFLGRVIVLPFFPLAPDVLRKIIKLKLGKVVRRVNTNYRAKMEYAPEVVSSILARCTEVASGARNVDNILNRSLLPELSAEFLAAMAAGKAIESVYLGLNDDGTFSYTIS